MKYDITEEQFLIYNYGEAKGRHILDKDLPDHYRTAYQKLQNGGNFGWNWAAFFFGSLWFIYQGMPLVFFGFFISMPIITTMTTLTLGILGFFASLILFGTLAGFLGDQLLINRLSKKLKNGYFDDLHQDTQSKFIEKMGVTEEQYLTFIYGQEKAQSLIKYNIPNHYREAFKKFALGRKIIWNWGAMHYQLWFIYRRLNLCAIIFLITNSFLIFFSFSTEEIVNTVISSPSFLGASYLAMIKLIQFIGNLLLFLTPLLFANYILLCYMKKQIENRNFNYLPNGPSKTFLYIQIAASILSFVLLMTFIIFYAPTIYQDHLSRPDLEEQLRKVILMPIIFFGLALMIIPIIAMFYTRQKTIENKEMMKEKL